MSSSQSMQTVDSDPDIQLRPGNIVIESRRPEADDERRRAIAEVLSKPPCEEESHATAADEAAAADPRDRAERVRDDYFLPGRYFPSLEEIATLRRDLFETKYNSDRTPKVDDVHRPLYTTSERHAQPLARSEHSVAAAMARVFPVGTHGQSGSDSLSDDERAWLRRSIARNEDRPVQLPPKPTVSDVPLVGSSLWQVPVPHTSVRLTSHSENRSGAQRFETVSFANDRECGDRGLAPRVDQRARHYPPLQFVNDACLSTRVPFAPKEPPSPPPTGGPSP